MKNKIFIIIYSLTTLILLSSCTADIRTSFMKEHSDSKRINEIKGRKILEESAHIHGHQAMQNLNTYEVDFTDKYRGFYKYFGNPYPNSEMNMKLHFIPFSFDGRIDFLDGEWKNRKWGIQSWNTYIKNEHEDYKLEKNKNIRFWIPTYQYFIEMPFRLLEGDICTFAGEEIIKNDKYNLVFISWKTEYPQKEIDQYIAWINKKTKLIDFVEFTVRDESRLIKAVAQYEGYNKFSGILFPSTITVKMKLDSKNYLHQMRLHAIRYNQQTKEQLRPLSNIRKYYKH